MQAFASAESAGDDVEWGRLQGCAGGLDGDERSYASAEVARLPMAERLRMHCRGDLDEIEEGQPTEHTFHLPHALVEMWRETVRACRLTFGNFITIAEAGGEPHLKGVGRRIVGRRAVTDRQVA